MTRAEIAQELGVSESYVRGHWQEIVRLNARINITLVKLGIGEKARYGIKSYGDNELRWTLKDK